jgi:transcriptional regulator with PAS, ATPase and Fis domain
MTKAEIQQVKLRFGIIGNTDSLVRAIDVAIQVAPTDLSVLITGESGVGKESFPQIIHQFSRRKHGQYIAVNCGAIPEGTIDSELFGHEKGAFTGAIGERKGYFGEADGGTIFLDEVGELPLPTQARLLRVLESGEFIKVGSSKVQKTDVRIVAATNVNLSNAIAEGRFREDLFYRLNTVPIQIPPLRERGDDVVLLFRKFASDFAEKYRMPAIQLTEDARKVLVAYSWPGNVRQLKNITEQISIIETNREINSTILQSYLPQQSAQRLPALFGVKQSKGFESEREILYQVLFDMRQDVTELKDWCTTSCPSVPLVQPVCLKAHLLITPLRRWLHNRSQCQPLTFTPWYLNKTKTLKTRKNMWKSPCRSTTWNAKLFVKRSINTTVSAKQLPKI